MTWGKRVKKELLFSCGGPGRIKHSIATKKMKSCVQFLIINIFFCQITHAIFKSWLIWFKDWRLSGPNHVATTSLMVDLWQDMAFLILKFLEGITLVRHLYLSINQSLPSRKCSIKELAKTKCITSVYVLIGDLPLTW